MQQQFPKNAKNKIKIEKKAYPLSEQTKIKIFRTTEKYPLIPKRCFFWIDPKSNLGKK